MPNSTLTLSYVSTESAVTPTVAVIIEQENWLPYTGKVTNTAVLRLMLDILYGEESSPANYGVQCGLIDYEDTVAFSTFIHVYPFVPELSYQLKLSHGDLGARVVSEVVEEEEIHFNLNTSLTEEERELNKDITVANLKYPVLGTLLSVRWVGVIFDKDGNPTQAPEVVLTAKNRIEANKKVYGMAKVSYTTVRHSYTVNVPKRPSSYENHFSSVAFAVYSGGLVYLELTPPPGAKEYNGYVDSQCGYGGANATLIPEPDGEPAPIYAYADKLIRKDYCTQEIISEEIYGRTER